MQGVKKYMAKRLYNELLRKHTTFRIGGPADELYIPESKEELIQEIRACIVSGKRYRIMGNGSNLLVRNIGVRGIVIKNTSALSGFEVSGNQVIVGSSMMLPRFVRLCVDSNLEGMEYLYSIPGTVGGALYMNAGRGKDSNMAISDNLVWVNVFDGKNELCISKHELGFSFRKSIFHQRKGWLILDACFQLQGQDKEKGMEEIRKRMDFVKNSQNRKYPSAGSVYDAHSRLALRIMRGVRIGGCTFQGNWISNVDNGCSRDVLRLLHISRILHFLLFNRPPVLEIEIW